jgi:hypothetical protein
MSPQFTSSHVSFELQWSWLLPQFTISKCLTSKSYFPALATLSPSLDTTPSDATLAKLALNVCNITSRRHRKRNAAIQGFYDYTSSIRQPHNGHGHLSHSSLEVIRNMLNQQFPRGRAQVSVRFILLKAM